MLESDQSFFYRNISNVNKKINLILFFTIPVPIIFAIVTIMGVWIVPHTYSLTVFLYSLIASLVYRFLIKKNYISFL